MNQFIRTEQNTFIPVAQIDRIVTRTEKHNHEGRKWVERIYTLSTTDGERHTVDECDLPELRPIIPNANPRIKGISATFYDDTLHVQEMAIVAWRLEKFIDGYMPEPVYLADSSVSSNEIRGIFDSEHGRVWMEYEYGFSSRDEFIKYAETELREKALKSGAEAAR
jgi:hypothetical protein